MCCDSCRPARRTRPARVERVGVEAPLEHALCGVGQQHQAARSGAVDQLLELGEPRRAEVLRLVDDDDVEARGDGRPVAVQVADGDGVPPRRVGIGRHLQQRHAFQAPSHRVERPDRESVVRWQPLDEVGAERVVVAGEQDRAPPSDGTARPRRCEACLAAPSTARSRARGGWRPAAPVPAPAARIGRPCVAEPAAPWRLRPNRAQRSVGAPARRRRPGRVRCPGRPTAGTSDDRSCRLDRRRTSWS